MSPRAGVLYSTFKIATPRAVPLEEAKDVVAKITAQRSIYDRVSRELGGHMPWWFVGCLHYRENTTLSQRAYLGNGQLIIGSHHKTTIAPRGRGPFKTWDDGAIDILRHVGFDKFTTWTTPEVLERTEIWNGMGYANLGRKIVNPYLFAGTSAYIAGKFIADGQYSSKKIDKQLGTAVLMKVMGIA